MAPNPHELLDQAMEDRRLELGMTWKEVSAQSGVTVETLSALRKGRTNPHNASPLTRRGIERALKWAPGGYGDALEGRKPKGLAEDVPHPEHAPPKAGAADEVEELVERFRRLPLDKQREAFRELFEELHQATDTRRGEDRQRPAG
ncbi:helix-turn-helix domain-containing protein [Streptomyces sp. NPDC001406]|uniref:helix-turn-helix domain-containing protein n=1 Tax=Streptomyces sp. NPDC001406 TaxID=3364572 RepID=UPI00367BBF4B